jgi:hypothetical protein
MAERPIVNVGDWIRIGERDCVVSDVRPPELVAFAGDIEVVFDAAKPTSHDAEWDGSKWVFSKRPDYGGYAEGKSRLASAVHQLKRGRWAR